MVSATKIVATLGPASLNKDVLKDMIVAGVSVVRINCSHGDILEHAVSVKTVKSIAKELNKPVAVLGDLQGPKIRVGTLPEAGVLLLTGQTIMFKSGYETLNDVCDTEDVECIPVAYPFLAADVDTGDRVLLADGLLETIVLDSDKEKGEVVVQVVKGGILKSRKGINLPGVAVSVKSPTEQDLEHLSVLIGAGVDYVALSFVSSASDVKRLRYAIALLEGREDASVALMEKDFSKDPYRTRTGIVSKLERPESITNLGEILEVSDAVMVARGDLGVETGPEYVPVLQKRIITLANAKAVPVITATEMLESMIKEYRPTRAEASDVANAVFDGTDAVMLSGETAVGIDPVNVVQTMRRICDQAEKAENFCLPPILLKDAVSPSLAFARSVKRMVEDLSPKAVVVFTETGASARLVSSVRPGVPVLALSPSAFTLRRCELFKNVTPGLEVEADLDLAVLLQRTRAAVKVAGLAAVGDLILVVSGTPKVPGGTNSLQVVYV